MPGNQTREDQIANALTPALPSGDALELARLICRGEPGSAGPVNLPINMDATGALFASGRQIATGAQFSGLVAGQGGASAYGGGYARRPFQHVAVPFGQAVIDEKVLAGATTALSVDPANTWNGRPSTKVTISVAGTNTVVECGISTASFLADSEVALCASRVLAAAVKIAVPQTLVSATLYIGDATYTNNIGFDLVPVDTVDGWTILTKETAGATFSAGNVNFSNPVRCKLRLTFNANVGVGSINYGGVYVMPQPQPSVVFMLDDGYAEWPWLAAEAKKRGIPLSMGISYKDVGTPGYMTWAQITELQNDPSGLFEFTNHAAENIPYGTKTLAQYLDDCITCRKLLVDAGVPWESASCHQYVQGIFDQALINALKANGFLCAREVGASNRRALSENIILRGAQSDALYKLPATVNLENTQTLATVKTYIANAAPNGGAVIMGHKFRQAAASVQWIAGYDSSYGVLDLLDWLAYMRDTAGWRILKLSTWRADMVAIGWRGSAVLS